VRKGAGDQVGSQPRETRDEPDPQIVIRNPEQRRITRKAARRGFAESPQHPAKPAKSDLAANREMTRIEFQTADPNIRIIWFAPKTDASPISRP
jgi:hypothetical protein